MEQIEEFRQHAEECRTLAAKSSNAEYRQKLLELAAQWDSLAIEREKLVKTQERLKEVQIIPP